MATPLYHSREILSGGEVTPLLLARYNIPQTRGGLFTCRNMLVLPHGGLLRRPGSNFAAVAGQAAPVRLMSISSTSTDTYTVEAGDGYFRFFSREGVLVEDGGSPFELETPYSQEDLPLLQMAEGRGFSYIVHPDHAPRRLTYTDGPTFSLSEVEFSNNRAPLLPINSDTDAKIITANGSTYDRRITCDKAIFTATDVGRVFFWQTIEAATLSTAGTAYGIVRQYISPTVIEVDYTFRDPATNSPAGDTARKTSLWAFGAFGPGRGCRAVEFHEGRLVYGGFADGDAEDWLAFSVSAQYDNFEFSSFDPDLLDSDNADKAIYRRASARSSSPVLWLRSSVGSLLVGTRQGERRVTSGSDDVLTPSNTAVRPSTSVGVSEIPGVEIGSGAVAFLNRTRTALHQYRFDVSQNAYSSGSMTLESEHLLRQSPAQGLVYQQSPTTVLWIPRSDGVLCGWTVEQEQSLRGAHRHDFGGSYNGGAGFVASVAVQPGSNSAGRRDVTGFSPSGTGAFASTNWGFEEGDLTDWDVVSGTWSVVTSNLGVTAPDEGDYFVVQTGSAAAEIRRDISLLELSDFSATLVDQGQTTIDVSVSIASPNLTTARPNFIVEALDGAGNVVQTVWNAGEEQNGPDGEYAPSVVNQWDRLSVEGRTLAATTRSVRFRCVDLTSAINFTAFDDIDFTLRQNAIEGEPDAEQLEDRVWLAVLREVDGTRVQHIEYLSRTYHPSFSREEGEKVRSSSLEDAVFTDASATYFVPVDVQDIAPGTETTVTAAGHGFSDGDRVRLRGVVGSDSFWLEDVDRVTFVVGNATADTFTIAPLTDPGTPLDTSGRGGPAINQTTAHLEVQAVTGVDHLIGETVQVVADGAYIGDAVVASDGSVALPGGEFGSRIVVGLGYTSAFETFPIVENTPAGVSMLYRLQSFRVTAAFENSYVGWWGAGPDTTKYREQPMGPAGQALGRPYAPITGYRDIALRGTTTKELTIGGYVDIPIPFNPQGFILRGEIEIAN